MSRDVLEPDVVLPLMRRHRVPGLSLAVIRDFEIVALEAYGVADAASETPVGTETLFQAASISKPVAAMVSLVAVQNGLFALDQNVDTILRQWRHPPTPLTSAQPVTPRALMSHTAGFGDRLGFPGYDPNAPLPSIARILDGVPPANTKAVRLEWPPMTASCYSGGGVLVQQLALTDVVGRPFSEIAREWVLEPAGMDRSSFDQPLQLRDASRAARGHDGSGAPFDPPWHVYPELAAAGLWSTAGDLARFAIEVQATLAGNRARILPRKLMQEMVSGVGGGPYGVGFLVGQAGGEPYFGHGGSNRGYRCDLVAHRTKGYGLVVMTNGEGGEGIIDELRLRIGRAYGWIR